MVFGNPNQVAFIVNRVREWESNGFINGLFSVYIDGQQYPTELRTTTLNSDLPHLLLETSPLSRPENNFELFLLEASIAFRKLYFMAFPADETFENDYRYLVPAQEILDSGICIFVIANGQDVRFLSGEVKGLENEEFINIREAVIEKAKLLSIVNALRSFYLEHIFNI